MELYFYTHLESDFHRKRVMALLDGTLLLSNPSKFNDLFDCQLSLNNEDLPEGEALQKMIEPSSLVELLLVGQKNWPELRLEIERRRSKTASGRYGVFCFSECWDQCLMWSHYARSHQGICLKLNVNQDALPESDVLAPIRYTTHYPVLSGQKIEDEDSESIETLLITKSVDWLYEKEWRYITPDPAPRKKRKARCSEWLTVEEVYFGSRFDEHQFSSLLKGSEHGDDPQTIKEVFEWVKSDDREKLRQYFELNDNSKLDELLSKEQMLLELRRRKIRLRKCIKSKSRYDLELDDFGYDLEKAVEYLCQELISDSL